MPKLGALLQPPPVAPQTPLPKTGPLDWFDKMVTLSQGLLGVGEPDPQSFQTPEDYAQAKRYWGTAQIASLLGPGVLGAAVKGKELLSASEDAAPAVRQTLKAYHGSPHDFGEVGQRGAFTKSAIGSGEGGQAYGYGHYFAQNPEVAAQYRQALGGEELRVNGKAITRPPDQNSAESIHYAAANAISAQGYDKSVKVAKEMIDNGADPKWVSRYVDALDSLKSQKVERVPKGKSYELNLHTSPESLLDWDKPLSQQPQKVQEALKKAGVAHDAEATAQAERTLNSAWDTYQQAGKKLGWANTRTRELEGDWQDARIAFEASQKTARMTGEEVYQALVKKAGGRAGHTEGLASQQLAEAGIHGVQYLDQGSRTTGQVVKLHGKYYFSGSSQPYETMEAADKAAEAMAPRTRNYVIFPHFEHLIEISKKYGISLPAAASLYKWQQSQKGVE